MINKKFSEPPVEVEQILEEMEIIGIAKKGDGVGRVDGFVVMVPETEVGKNYKVKINKVLMNMAFGEVVG